MSNPMRNDTDRAISALHAIPNDLSGDDWLRPSIGAKAAGVDFDTWHAWCAGASNYKGESDCRARWKSFDTNGPIQAGTLFKAAAEHGWRMGGNTTPRPASERVSKPVDTPRKPAPGMSAAEVWERCQPATSQHPYAIKKQASQEAMPGLRVVPADDSLHIGGASMAGALVVPCMAGDGSLSTLQLIPPAGKKMNLPGCKVEGWFTVGNIETGQTVYIVEGIGQAWACWVTTMHKPTTVASLREATKAAFNDLQNQISQLRNDLHRLRADLADLQGVLDEIEPRLVAVELR